MMPLIYIENRTYDEIQVGESATITRTLKPQDIQLFAIMSGDVNPAHVDPEYAKSSMFREVIAHGMWGGALISTVLGTQFPGPGTIYIDQTLHFSRPVGLGDVITVTLTATRKFDHNHHIIFDCLCTNQDGQKVIGGTAEVLAPTQKVKRARIEMPEVTLLDRGARYKHLLDRTKGMEAIPMAVAHPCDAESLRGVDTAVDEDLIVPILVGPAQKIRAIAREHGLDLGNMEIIDVAHSHDPYKGQAPAAQDLIAGQIQVMFDAMNSALPNIKLGRVRALGVASLKRSPDLPALPTIAEQGVPGYETNIWLALFLPAATPPALVDRLHAEVVRVMTMPEVRERLVALGMQPATNTPAEMAAYLKSDIAKWSKVVRDGGIKLE